MTTKTCDGPGADGGPCGVDVFAKGLCRSHYDQQRNGRALTPYTRRTLYTGVPCKGPGCDRQAHSLGYCQGHYNQVRRGRPLAPLAARTKHTGPCVVDGCSRIDTVARGMCSPHYEQWRRERPGVREARAAAARAAYKPVPRQPRPKAPEKRPAAVVSSVDVIAEMLEVARPITEREKASTLAMLARHDALDLAEMLGVAA